MLCDDVPPRRSFDGTPSRHDALQDLLAQDANFTNVVQNVVTRTQFALALRQRSRLPESQAGEPYYWYVRP